MEKQGPFTPVDEERMNRKDKYNMDKFLNTMDSAGEDVKENKKGTADPGKSDMEPVKIMEALDVINHMLVKMYESEDNNDLINEPMIDDGNDSSNDNDILERLNKLYTPTLISQKFENDIADDTNNEIQNAGNLNKRTMVNFNKKDRVAQLVRACAMLIAEKKKSNDWQILLKADAMKKQATLNIQKEEHNAAMALAQRYLIMVSTTNNSSVARDAAQELIPETQH